MKKVTLTTLSLLIAGSVLAIDDRKPLPGKETRTYKHDKVEKPKRPGHKKFPPHWGKPPAVQTKDLRPLPYGFGLGSSTLAKWIMKNVKEDLADKEKPKRPKRPEPSKEVKDKITALNLVKKDINKARSNLRDSLKDKSKESRIELIKQFKDSQKEKHIELKQAHKALLEEIRKNKQTGTRRE